MKTIDTITFGTSGYRGVIGDTFTIPHVTAIGLAIASYVKLKQDNPRLILGFDPREGNTTDYADTSFVAAIIQALQAMDVKVDCCRWPTPTPVISWAITHFNLSGGIILTASHNPTDYNGIKLNDYNGAPASLEATQYISQSASTYLIDLPKLPPIQRFRRRYSNYERGFTRHLKNIMFNLFPSHNKKPISSIAISIDAKHGACARTWREISDQFHHLSCRIRHGEPLPDFGGQHPNPTQIEHLTVLQETIINDAAHFGIANDPDGDRHVILDEKGIALSPEEVAAIIAHYLGHQKNTRFTTIMTTLASSQLMRRVAIKWGLHFIETPIGFKYFTPHLEALRHNASLGLAVESSGGFTLSHHTMEKCGFLPGLLMAFICHDTGQSVSQLRQCIYDEYGHYYFIEDAMTVDSSRRSLPTQRDILQPHFNSKIQSINDTDGVKLILEEDQWILARPSGTEPVIRLYSEASKKSQAESLIRSMKSVLNCPE